MLTLDETFFSNASGYVADWGEHEYKTFDQKLEAVIAEFDRLKASTSAPFIAGAGLTMLVWICDRDFDTCQKVLDAIDHLEVLKGEMKRDRALKTVVA